MKYVHDLVFYRQKDDTIAELKNKADILKLELENSKQNNQADIDKREQNELELSELKEQLDAALKDIQAKRDQIDIITSAKIASEKTLTRVKSDHEFDLSNKSLEVGQLQQRLEALESELGKAKLDLSQEIIKNEMIANELNTTKNHQELSKRDLEDLNRVINMAEQEIAGLETENKKLKERIDEYDSEVKSPEDHDNTKNTSSEEPPVENYISENTDIKTFVEAHLRSYDVELPVTVNKKFNNKGFCSLTIGEKKISARINNNKFYVLAGGGWYTLQVYIETYILKMSYHKNNNSDARLSFGNLLGRKSAMAKTSKGPRISLDSHNDSNDFSRLSYTSPNKTMKSKKSGRT